MAKTSGLGDRLFVAGYDFSGDVTAVDKINGGPEALEPTGIDKAAMERIGGLRDGGIEATTWFNPSANMGHDRLSILPFTDVIVSYFRGTTLGDSVANCVAKQADYEGKRDDKGAFTFASKFPANGYGVEWGEQLTAGRRTDTTATNGASVDNGAVGSPSAFGLAAYLHVFALTGTSVIVKIQSSSDDGAGDAWTDVAGATFIAATGITSERIATSPALSVERYLRVVSTGTFTNAQFAVAVVRNLTAVE